MNKKKILIGFSIVLIILCISGGVGYQIIRKKQLKIEDINNHYEEYVIINKDTKIYQKENNEYIEFGKVKESMTFMLEELEKKEEPEEYFKLKNETYYLYYQDVIPQDDITIEKKKDYYLESPEKIKTKEKTSFYKNDEIVLEFNQSMEFSYFQEKEDAYQIEYLGKILDLKKDHVVKMKTENKKEQAEYIPVLKIETIKEDCTTNLCIKTETLKNDLKILQENYDLWKNGSIFLKKGAIYLNTENDSESISKLLAEYQLETITNEEKSLTITNTSSRREDNFIQTYTINEETQEEHIKKIIAGEPVIYPKKEEPKYNTNSLKTLPSQDKKASQIAVLNYHFFYDPNGEECSSSICLDSNKFREHLTFFKENNYKTLTMEEYRAWIYGEIELPARSVLITIDDGAKGTGRHNGNKLIPLLEEFQMHATLFLISGWWAKENYESKYLDIESHTFDMHTEGLCSTETRGAKMLCSSKEEVMADLKKSIETIGSNTAFCFPFYAFNHSAIESVKESGFKLAFIGGSTKSTRDQDKYKIPRYPIQSDITINQLINMIA